MSDSSSLNASTSGRSWRKWVAGAVLLVFFGVLMREVINPYRNQRFEKVPHGSHVHYAPKDKNPDVPISQFPTQKPDENEDITPDGRVVPKRQSGTAP